MKRHAMSEFGTVYGDGSGVRANRLERRLAPLVPFPHRHAFYHLVAVTAGTGWHEIDFRRHPVRAGQFFLMRPGQVHSWSLGARTRGFVIEFEESALPRKEGALVAEALATTPECGRLSDRAQTLLSWMADEYDGRQEAFEVALRHALAALLIDLSRSPGGARAPSPADPLLDRFVALVEESFEREHEVASYAKRLSVTPKALTMRAARALGRSARAVIQERVLLESRRMLAYSDLSVAEVGYALGFDDPNYFARFFRLHAGLSPGAFRERTRTPGARATRDRARAGSPRKAR